MNKHDKQHPKPSCPDKSEEAMDTMCDVTAFFIALLAWLATAYLALWSLGWALKHFKLL